MPITVNYIKLKFKIPKESWPGAILVRGLLRVVSPNHDLFNPTSEEGVCDSCKSTKFNRRADDNADTVLSRLKAYHEQTSPLANWYGERGIFFGVDGDRDIPEITSDIIKILVK